MLLPDLSKLTLTISAKIPTRSDRLAAKQKAVVLIRQLGKSRKTDEITQLIALLEQIVKNNISEDVEREIQDLNLPQGVTSARKNAIEFLKELVNVKERNVPKKKNTSASPQIVGRSTDIFQGVVEHSFLVFYPGRATERINELSKYKWWTKEMMSKNGTLNNLLNSWLVANGNSLEDPDPRDRGWARKIIAKRISNRRQEYIVQWHADENVPERAAQNRLGGRQIWEWKRRNQLLSGAQNMVDQFNKLPGSYESELNIDDLDHDQDIGALQWSTSRGQPVVSLYRAIILYTRQQPAQRVVGVLIEYTLSRIWALRSRIPKRNDADDEWDITDAEKTQLGRDLFFLNEKMLTKSFNEELKNPAIDDENDDEELDDEEQYDDDDDDDMNDDDDEDEEDESYDSKFEEFKSNMEQTLVNDTIWRWNYTWKVYETQLNTLTTQLECLQAIRDTVDNKITSVNVNTIENEAVKSMINLWITKGDDWPAQLASPKLDLPDIKDFLTIDGSSRSVQAQRWLELQRIAHSEATDWRSDIFGSAYSARWEPNATPKNTPPDHVVPQKWMESSRLIFESRDPRQLPAVVLCRLQENSAKSDSRLGLVFTDDRTSRSNNVWVPPQPISDKKKAMLAKTIAWVFLLYWGVSSNKADRNIYKFHGNVKESLYLLAWNKRNARFTTMKDLVKTESTAHEKRFALLSLAMPSWQVANPLIFDPSLMSQEFDNLLTKRFSGEDDLSWLIDRVLYLAVAGAPDIHK